MSRISKLQITLGIAFTFITAGAISLSAQTAGNSNPMSTNLRSDSANEPKRVEGVKPSVAPPDNPVAPEKTTEVKSEKDSNGIGRASAPDTATAPESETATTPRSQPAPDDRWHFQFTPYFWLASLHGTAGVGTRSTQVDESFGDVWHVLNFAFMGTVEARKRKLVVLVDTEYVSIEDDKATPGPLFSSLNAKFKTFIFDPEVGYRVYENSENGSSLDVLGGVRVWHVNTDLTFSPGILAGVEVEGSRNWVDGVAGVRGRAALSKKAFVTGKADLGGGGSKFTYQLFGGVGYSIKENIALIGGYRVLDVNYNKNGFLYNMNQRGPIFGVGFKF